MYLVPKLSQQTSTHSFKYQVLRRSFYCVVLFLTFALFLSFYPVFPSPQFHHQSTVLFGFGRIVLEQRSGQNFLQNFVCVYKIRILTGAFIKTIWPCSSGFQSLSLYFQSFIQISCFAFFSPLFLLFLIPYYQLMKSMNMQIAEKVGKLVSSHSGTSFIHSCFALFLYRPAFPCHTSSFVKAMNVTLRCRYSYE